MGRRSHGAAQPFLEPTKSCQISMALRPRDNDHFAIRATTLPERILHLHRVSGVGGGTTRTNTQLKVSAEDRTGKTKTTSSGLQCSGRLVCRRIAASSTGANALSDHEAYQTKHRAHQDPAPWFRDDAYGTIDDVILRRVETPGLPGIGPRSCRFLVTAPLSLLKTPPTEQVGDWP